jgi:hypothetical protein
MTSTGSGWSGASSGGGLGNGARGSSSRRWSSDGDEVRASSAGTWLGSDEGGKMALRPSKNLQEQNGLDRALDEEEEDGRRPLTAVGKEVARRRCSEELGGNGTPASDWTPADGSALR